MEPSIIHMWWRNLFVLGRQQLLQELVVFQETHCVLWCYPILMATCSITRRKYCIGWRKATEQWVPCQCIDRDTHWGNYVLEGENGRLGSLSTILTLYSYCQLDTGNTRFKTWESSVVAYFSEALHMTWCFEFHWSLPSSVYLVTWGL